MSKQQREKFRKLREAREVEGLVKRERYYDKLSQVRTSTHEWAQLIPRWFFKAQAVIDGQCAFDHSRPLIDRGELDDFILPQVVLVPPYSNFVVEWRMGQDENYGIFEGQRIAVGFNLSEESPDQNDASYWPIQQWGGKCCVIQELSYLKPETHTAKIYRFESGSYDALAITGNPAAWGENDWEEDQIVNIAFWAIALMNDTHAKLVEHKPAPGDVLSYGRHFGVPMITYKELVLKPEQTRWDYETREQEPLGIMPLHSVRAHERNAPNHPIPQFRHSQIPAHTRGNEKNGIVAKDYKVKP